MDSLPDPILPENGPPVLANARGWTFVPESAENGPGRWRGAVRIQAGATRIVRTMRCGDCRGSPDEALEDARRFAREVFLRIAEQFRRVEASHRTGGSRPPR